MAKHRRLVLASVGALGVSCVMTQLALMRELLGVFSGNEMVLGIVLGLWLLLMGLGAGLGRRADRLRDPLNALALILMFLAVLPPAQVFLVRALRNVVFIRGAAVGVTETVGATFVLLLPYCLMAGYGLTLACMVLAREEGAKGIGSAYVADGIGSIVGGAVFSLVLVRMLDHIALLVLPALLNLALAWLLGLQARSSRFEVQASKFRFFLLPALAPALAAGLVGVTLILDPDTVSTYLQFPRQQVVAHVNSPYGRLVVTESAGQYDILENGVPVTSTRDVQHVEETVHYAMAQRPEARRMLLVSGGISGTAKEILKHGVHGVDYVELDLLILALGREYLPGSLADDRIRAINTDGRLFVRQTPEKYDVVIIDAPAPMSAQVNRFYTAEFLAEVKGVLTKDGVACFALGQCENYVSPALARMLSSARQSAQQSFRHVLALPGGRVFFLASDGPLFTDIAERLEQRQVKTQLVNRHYLSAMLTPDRMAALAQATTQPADANTDFNPVLYYYHLRHWMSQFDLRFGAVEVAALLVLAIYVVRLRGSALVLFASGFAASTLEVVLLLAFQVLCGSVYHQVGVIVTVFMAGLALGAWLANRVQPHAAPQEPRELPTPCLKRLSFLAFLIAAYAVLLPFTLPLLNRLGGSTASLAAVEGSIGLLTLILAVLVGMQFPLANQLEFDGTARGPARLYRADFMGACLGALLACTLLIPLIGVTGVCLLTGVGNVAAGLAGGRQRAR